MTGHVQREKRVVIQLAHVRERNQRVADQKARELPHVQRYVEFLSVEDRTRWEKHCRREASRTGWRLTKSYRRDPKHPEFGHYKLLNVRKTASADGRRRGGKHFPGPWLTLAGVLVELWGGWEDALRRSGPMTNEEQQR
jgi:hypothetical protein